MKAAVLAPPVPALAVYGRALRRVLAGGPAALVAVDEAGRRRPVPAASWCGGLIAGDGDLLDRCTGATLDVGCGPGRLTAALAARGRAALGVDLSATALAVARRRGADVLRADVFGPLPGEGAWRQVLLADGNIGIGGDPARLLGRCRQLTGHGGRVLVEVGAPGSATWSGRLRVEDGAGPGSDPFPWAYVAADDLAALAAAAALSVLGTWTEVGRWFAELSAH